MTSRSSPRSATGSPSCTPGGSSKSLPSATPSRTPSPPMPSCSYRRFRHSTARKSSESEVRSRTCATPRADARSTLAAPSPLASARRTCRSTSLKGKSSSSLAGCTRRSNTTIAADGVSKTFPVRGALRARTTVEAVEDGTVRLAHGHIVGLVGERGSGKSTLGRIMVHLLEPTRGDGVFDLPDDMPGEYEDARASGDQEALGRIRAAHSLTYRQRPALRWRPLLRWALGLMLGGTLRALLPALAIAFS